MVNAQAYSSDSTSSSSANGETHAAQIEICQVGVGGPYSGDSIQPGRDEIAVCKSFEG
jgi:hypothetical protein